MGVWPAEPGKTYLAVAMAVKAFKAHEVEKTISHVLWWKQEKKKSWLATQM